MIELLKVKDFASVITGGTPSTAKNEYWNGGSIPWLNSGELNQEIITSTRNYITEKGLQNSSTRLMPADSVLIALTGSTTGVVGYLTFEACANQSVSGVLPSDKHFPKYLYYFLKSIRKKIVSDAYGGAQPHISQGYIKELQIPLPPLEQQKKIAAILDEADAYRQKTKALIAKYDELTQSLFLEMFGDPVKNEKGWEKVKMEKLMTIVRGGSPRPIDDYLGGTYPWIKIGDATKGDDIYLNSTKQHITADGLHKTRLLPKGSLIFANCGVSLGFARIINFEGCIHDGWLAFSGFDEKKISKIFLLKSLNSVTQYFRNTAPDGTQPNLNIAIMKNFEIILPPIFQQEVFEKCLLKLVAQKAQAQASLQKAEELFNSLLQRAFKGELV